VSPGFDRVSVMWVILPFTQLPDRHLGDLHRSCYNSSKHKGDRFGRTSKLDSTRPPPGTQKE